MKKFFLLIMLFMWFGDFAMSQTRVVTGVVTSSTEGPIVGASVIVSGTTIGVITGVDGRYSIAVPQDATSLTFTFIGMSRQEIQIGGRSVIDVLMEPDIFGLDEVVVTALGIPRERKALGYAIAEVNVGATALKGEPDLLKAIQGRVAGVDIRTSQGMPGASSRINVRGNSSFLGDNQPLIVVDGIPLSNTQVTSNNQLLSSGAYSSGFSSLDPNDIESITILKGSSASVLWGSRASNGAILITTKSGGVTAGKSKTEVSITSSMNWETIASLPDYQNTYGAGSQFGYSHVNVSFGPRFDSLDRIPAWSDYLAAFPELFPDGTIPYEARPNNVKDLFQTGFVVENSVNMKGGTEKAAFNATLSNMNHKGYVPNSSYERNSISLGGSAQLSNKFAIRGNTSFVKSSQKGTLFGHDLTGVSTAFARSLFLARNWDLAAYPYEDANGKPVSIFSTQFDNPFWMYRHNTSNTDEARVIASFGAEYTFTPWLKANYTLGTNYYTLGRKEIVDIGSRAAGGMGRIRTDDYTNQMTESTLLLTFNKNLSDQFSLVAIAGHNLSESKTTRKTFEGDEMIARGVYTLSNTKTVLNLADAFYKNRLVGVFADISIGYNHWAYLTLSGRNDWSSTLPKKNRSYFYPAISGSVIFTEALNLHNDILSFGKIRANWAKVGRDADPYSLYDIYVVEDPILGQSAAKLASRKNNMNLQPEFTEEIEIGTQLNFLRNRIGIDFAWYNKLSTNQIMPIDLPYSSGHSSIYANAGELKNTGIEIDLRLKAIELVHWSWELRGIFTKNKNTVIKLTNNVERIPLRSMLDTVGPFLEPGMPFGYIRGGVSARDDDGNLLINKSTGLLIRAAEQAMIGNPNPDFKLGVSSMLRYKGFFMSALFDFTKGGSIYSTTINNLLGRGVTKDTEDREHAWIIPGYYGDPNTRQPILDANGNKIPNTTVVSTQDLFVGESFASNAAQEWYVFDATVYRLREISFGYSAPSNLLDRTPFGSASIVFNARNLWYFAPGVPRYTNFDPEVNSFGSTTTQGFDFIAAPSTRRYGFTLNFTF